jgi:hypothetical protein
MVKHTAELHDHVLSKLLGSLILAFPSVAKNLVGTEQVTDKSGKVLDLPLQLELLVTKLNEIVRPNRILMDMCHLYTS